MRRLSLLAAVLLLATVLLLAACDSGGDAIGITGDWRGTLTNGAAVYPVEVTFRDTGLAVSGSGRVEVPGAPFAFAVTGGTFLNGVATLNLTFSATPPTGLLSASLTQTDPGVLEGTFQGSGEANGALRIELVSR